MTTSEDIKKIFGKNLVRLLEENGKKQADLSKYMGVSSATVSEWCRGKKMPRVDKIQSICNWLNVEKSEILEDSETTARDAMVKRAIEYYKRLNPDKQKMAIEYLEYLLSKSKKDE